MILQHHRADGTIIHVHHTPQLQILDKGIPEGSMSGIAGRQIQLKDDENMIPGLLNSQGNKVNHAVHQRISRAVISVLQCLCRTNAHTALFVLKVRLTFKPTEQQVWIGSAASTQKGVDICSLMFNRQRFFMVYLGKRCNGVCVVYAVYYSQIKKIESHVIEGHEEYSILAFHLNAEGM